ncbi:cysteine desulfurase family protein [Pseudomonas marginalis]|uniref:cysteine desulfurase family protein n=1 Tax=Pseudomonas TaxID=286 RepID=UPI00389A36C4
MKTIYLDFAASTKCESDIVDIMKVYQFDDYANPASPHSMGKVARHAINVARSKVAKLLQVDPAEILFTSGATESNNIVVLGAFEYGETAPSNAIFSAIDHKSVTEAARELCRRGVDVRYVKIESDGRINKKSLEREIDSNTKLLSLCHVNSEVGVIQDLDMLSEVAASREIILHLDVVQSFGKIPLSLKGTRIDCVSFSAHKIGGPKGIGGLYLNDNARRKLRPLFFGGEVNSLRSGTMPTPLIVGFGAACELRSRADLQKEWRQVAKLRSCFLSVIKSHGARFELNVPAEYTIPHILSLHFYKVRSEVLISSLEGVCIAAGSACNSNNMQASYVLKGLGLSDEQANCSIRVSISPTIKEEEVREAAEIIAVKVFKLQSLV